MSVTRVLSEGWRKLKGAAPFFNKEQASEGNKVLDEYTTAMPSPQNAVDALPGWNHALPDQAGAIAGTGAFYNDPRILWVIEQFGDIEGRRILELGPLEGSHTYMLDQRNPAVVHAIEANKLSFFRCLVVKELLGLQRAKFMLGNFAEWLEHSPERYDLIIASGVLYHMENPVRLLELIAAKCDSFYLWTHYMSDEAMPVDDPRRGVFIGDVETMTSHGLNVRLYKRSYHGAWKSKAFCGGMHDIHRWIDRDDILSLIGALGFNDVRIQFDEPNHPNGPSFSLFAQRNSKA